MAFNKKTYIRNKTEKRNKEHRKILKYGLSIFVTLTFLTAFYNIVLGKTINLNSTTFKNTLIDSEPIVLEALTPLRDNDDVARAICKEFGLTEDYCWKDLRAMRRVESLGGKEMEGDNGLSYGWYHIQVKMHNITMECALDISCSTKWTVKNLIGHGYPVQRTYAISKHNGSGKAAEAYAKKVKNLSANY